MNYQYLTDNGVKILSLVLIVVAIGVLFKAKSGKVSDSLSTLVIVLVAFVILAMGGVGVAFGDKIANALFG